MHDISSAIEHLHDITVVAYDKDTYSGIVEVVEATDAQTAADQWKAASRTA